MDVWVSNRVAYLPITINASTTFTEHFKKLGWQLSQLDQLSPDIEVFAHFRDPIQRHLKGTAQFIFQNNLIHLLDDHAWQKVWCHAVMDIHSYPVTWAVGSRKIHWIPIGGSIDTTHLTRKFLQARGIDLGTVIDLNLSNPLKKQIEHRLQEIHAQQPYNMLSFFYDADIILWNSIFPYVDEDNCWHTVY